jgi:hypothetical protein
LRSGALNRRTTAEDQKPNGHRADHERYQRRNHRNNHNPSPHV